MAIVDKCHRVIDGLAGHSDDAWNLVQNEAFQAMKLASSETTGLCSNCEGKSWLQ